MKWNKIKYQQRVFISYCIINFLLIFTIFFIVFSLVSQFSLLFETTKYIEDEYLYSYHSNYYNREFTNKMKETAAYYSFEYLEIDEEYFLVLHTNKKGLELGVPYFGEQVSLMFFPFSITQIEENQYFTTRDKMETDKFLQLPFFRPYKLKNFLFNIQFDLEFLYVSDEYFLEHKYDMIVITEEVGSLNYVNHGFSENQFAMKGSDIKFGIIEQNRIQVTLLLILCFIPLFFSTFAIRNIYIYYITKNKDEIIINYIYYKSRKKIIYSIFLEIYIVALFSSLIALMIASFFSKMHDRRVIGISFILVGIFEMITIRRNTKKEVKKYCFDNEWREI